MHQFVLGLEPVIEGMALSHSTFNVKLVGSISDCLF
jgi:hypothetical protein